MFFVNYIYGLNVIENQDCCMKHSMILLFVKNSFTGRSKQWTVSVCITKHALFIPECWKLSSLHSEREGEAPQALLGEGATQAPVIDDYKRQYCYAGKESWESCKRFQVRGIVGKCPLDILPDSPMSAEEIIEKYDL